MLSNGLVSGRLYEVTILRKMLLATASSILTVTVDTVETCENYIFLSIFDEMET